MVFRVRGRERNLCQNKGDFQMTNKLGTLILLVSILFLSIPPSGFSATISYSRSQLTAMSDLVIRCKVVKIEPSRKTKDMGGLKGKVSYASLEIVGTLKGEASSPLTVEFVKFDNFVGDFLVEPDCQDAQFKIGEEGIAYLRKLPDGNYAPTAGFTQGFQPN